MYKSYSSIHLRKGLTGVYLNFQGLPEPESAAQQRGSETQSHPIESQSPLGRPSLEASETMDQQALLQQASAAAEDILGGGGGSFWSSIPGRGRPFNVNASDVAKESLTESDVTQNEFPPNLHSRFRQDEV